MTDRAERLDGIAHDTAYSLTPHRAMEDMKDQKLKADWTVKDSFGVPNITRWRGDSFHGVATSYSPRSMWLFYPRLVLSLDVVNMARSGNYDITQRLKLGRLRDLLAIYSSLHSQDVQTFLALSSRIAGGDSGSPQSITVYQTFGARIVG